MYGFLDRACGWRNYRGTDSDSDQKALVIDWVSVFQFFLFAVVSTPPNILW